MASESNEDASERQLLGRALAALRRRSGKNQAEAGEAYEALTGETMSAQGWGQIEAGKRQHIFTPESQRTLTAAVDATPEDLQAEVQRMRGVRSPPPLRVIDGMRDRDPADDFLVPLTTRARWGQTAEAPANFAYDIGRPDARMDLSWLFGGHAGFIRMASDHLAGRVERGETVIFDRLQSPRPDQLCVVETRAGESYVYVFRSRDSAKVYVDQLQPATGIEFDLNEVRGVYAVRLRGD